MCASLSEEHDCPKSHCRRHLVEAGRPQPLGLETRDSCLMSQVAAGQFGVLQGDGRWALSSQLGKSAMHSYEGVRVHGNRLQRCARSHDGSYPPPKAWPRRARPWLARRMGIYPPQPALAAACRLSRFGGRQQRSPRLCRTLSTRGWSRRPVAPLRSSQETHGDQERPSRRCLLVGRVSATRSAPPTSSGPSRSLPNRLRHQRRLVFDEDAGRGSGPRRPKRSERND